MSFSLRWCDEFARMHVPLLVVGLVLVAGCAGGPAEPAGTPQAPRSAPAPAPLVAAEQDLTPIVHAAVGRVSHPAAAVVLSASSGALLVRQEEHGADSARMAMRPGSTVKPLLAAIAIEAGALRADTEMVCEGNYAPIEGFHCHQSHGPLGLRRALAVSCNAYFFDVARSIGLERTIGGFAAFGFGRPTGLVGGEAAGLLPDRAWIDARGAGTAHDSTWPGWAAMIGGGHGPIEVTLIQLAAAYMRLAQRLSAGGGSEAQQRGFAAVRQGLIDAVDADYGTGRRAAVEGLAIAGKTGAAESGHFGSAAAGRDAAGEAKTNGWFVGFAPADRPEVVVAVVVVEAGPGGETAAPVAAEIFRGWQARSQAVAKSPAAEHPGRAPPW